MAKLPQVIAMLYLKNTIQLICLLLFLPFLSNAQTYHSVTHTNGAVVISGITVTVDTVTLGSSGIFCGVSPYVVNVGGFKFKFSTSIYRVRCHIVAVNTDDTVRIFLNGSHYNISLSNLQTYANGCYNGPMGIQILSGNIVGTTASTNVGQQLDIYYPSGIDSISIEQKSSGSGWVFDFAFAGLCPGNVIAGAINDTVCTGDTLHLSGSSQYVSNNVTYSWSGPAFSAISKDTIIANFGAANSGIYNISAFDTGGCVYTSAIYISNKTKPGAATLSGITSLCPGDSIRLSATSSWPALQYNWTGPGGFSDTLSVAHPTLFTSLDTGYYYLTTSNNCGTHLDSLHISNLQANSPLITTTSPVCSGQSFYISASTTTTNVTYSWTGPQFNSNLASNTISSASVANNGNYVVKITHSGCVIYDTVFVSVVKTPEIPILTSNSPVCVGDSLKLYSSDTSNNLNYSWTGPSFNSNLPNPFILNASIANSGTYNLSVSRNNCTASNFITINVHPLVVAPTVSISVSPSDSICLQDNVSFTAVANNGGTPVYKWKHNNVIVAGVTGPVYTANNFQNLDAVTATVISNLSCQPIDTGNSNAITMYVRYNAPPIVNLGVHTVGPVTTFTALITGNTSGLTYKWKKNGVVVSGQTTATYAANNLHSGDSVCLIVYSSIPCTVPDSVETCNRFDVGIQRIVAGNQNIKLYPNPVLNELHINNIEPGSEIIIWDIFGRKILQQTCKENETIISTQNFNYGNYLIEIYKEGTRQLFKICK